MVYLVENLGVNLLIGEPGKLDNCIRTDPLRRVVETLDIKGRSILVNYSDKAHKKSALIRATTSQTLYVGDSLQIQVPRELKSEKCLSIHPHKGNQWLSPTLSQSFRQQCHPEELQQITSIYQEGGTSCRTESYVL